MMSVISALVSSFNAEFSVSHSWNRMPKESRNSSLLDSVSVFHNDDGDRIRWPPLASQAMIFLACTGWNLRLFSSITVSSLDTVSNMISISTARLVRIPISSRNVWAAR